MRHRFFARAAAVAAGALALAAAPAGAHPYAGTSDDSWINSSLGVHWNSHGAEGSTPGRQTVPPGSKGLELVGKWDSAGKLGGSGRVADVSAKGNFAYLTMFHEPACGRGGVQVVDMSNPSNMQAVAYIPSHVDTFSGEGSQVVTMNTPSFKGDLLIYQNEWCPQTTNGIGGVTLVDVTNPRQPKKLVEGFGDFTRKSPTGQGTPQTKANQTHSAFAWEQRRADGTRTGKWFAVLVDDDESLDVDILDITNPSKPKLVSETNLGDTAQTGDTRPHGDGVFSHDMVVKHRGGTDTMLMSYWDGGYVTLDVSDPAAPKVLADTEFAAQDPARAEYGHSITPEGNAHQAEWTGDDKFFFATDEDFDAYRVEARFTGGPAAGRLFTAVQGADTKPVNRANPLKGDTKYVGLGCTALPAGSGAGLIAVAERGECDFQVKLDNIIAAGYRGLVVFNRQGEDGCETLVSMLATSQTTPAIFVSRTDGFRLLGVEPGAGYTCDAAGTTGTQTPAGPSVGVDISAVFDGWGYTHMYKADARNGTFQEVDFYAPKEGQLESFADDFGDLSVHEVATDPAKPLVYVSHYALGMRVLKYTNGGLEEVGHFVETGGSNYWGVEVHRLNGEQVVLGSDRDKGLRVFRFKP